MRLALEKVELVEALLYPMTSHSRERARRFLEGLSSDELQYIAAYLGAQLLDPELGLSDATRNQLAACIERYERQRRAQGQTPAGYHKKPMDREHRAGDVRYKMILLLEYLSMSTLHPTRWLVKAGSA